MFVTTEVTLQAGTTAETEFPISMGKLIKRQLYRALTALAEILGTVHKLQNITEHASNCHTTQNHPFRNGLKNMKVVTSSHT